ncbi:MAG: replication protein, partial [Lactiplantibacillus plantarum]|nr:replication protein [Lactiplantibacillus plantarum]
MAQRRMFSNRITDSAKFLKMPLSSQALYFHLGLHADDDGVVEAFSVMRQTGAVEDDLRILVAKNFVNVLNDDLVAYITDWNENNRIRADRKVDSIYKDLLLEILPNIELTEPKPRADTGKVTGRPMDNQWTGNGPHRLGKDRLVEVRLGKDNKDSHHSTKPNYDPSSQPYKIASHLLTRIKQRQSDFKEPNLQKWAND